MKKFLAVKLPCGRVEVRSTDANYAYVAAEFMPADYHAKFDAELAEAEASLAGTTVEALWAEVQRVKAEVEAAEAAASAPFGPRPSMDDHTVNKRPGWRPFDDGSGRGSAPDGFGSYSTMRGLDVDFGRWSDAVTAWEALVRPVQEVECAAVRESLRAAERRYLLAVSLPKLRKEAARAREVSGRYVVVSWHTSYELAEKRARGLKGKVVRVTASGPTKKKAMEAVQ